MAKLNFQGDIAYWSKQYNYDKPDLEKLIIEKMTPEVKRRGYLNKEEFLKVCEWKTDRSKSRCNKNDAKYVEEITQIALNTENERVRIEVLTLLDGVEWPTASVMLHFFHKDKYPVLDYRALSSLGIPKGTQKYSFDFWMEYVNCCREISEKSGYDMRTVDRALWAYSKANE